MLSGKSRLHNFIKKTHEENIVIKYTNTSAVVSLDDGTTGHIVSCYASNSTVSHNLEWKETR